MKEAKFIESQGEKEMKPKFTPGPWETTSENGWDAVKPESQKMSVCKLVENNPANACLIAAAPEMYEALEMVMKAWEDLEKPDYDEIDRVLKKARGEK